MKGYPAQLAFVSSLAFATPVLASDDCTPVHFAPGASSAEVSDQAPAEDVLCYSLQTVAGQRAHIAILEGQNVIFSIGELVDAQTDYAFTTEAKTYHVLVGQLMRSSSPEPFQIRMSVTGP